MDTDNVKQMIRLLAEARRSFLTHNWDRIASGMFSKKLSPAQINHLMLMRLVMPCNLAEVMKATGLSSAGASILIDKLVEAGAVKRQVNPLDRRYVMIDATAKARQVLTQIDRGLDGLIDGYLTKLSQDELDTMVKAANIICSALEKN